MRHSVWAGALAALLLPGPARAADKEEIDRAIGAGVEALRNLQRPDGSWAYTAGIAASTVGSTALGGLTLLECGAGKDDRAVLKAADFVRTSGVTLKQTYSISLAILFLDRLGDPADVPLLESLAARLVAGQTSTGGWSYLCPEPVLGEQRRLNELVTRRKPADPERAAPSKPGNEARDFQQRMLLLNRDVGEVGPLLSRADNSNTQFAIIALWVSRRHGFPVDHSLRVAERHFRNTQNADGGWWYGDKPELVSPSTATMTCAGLLGLAVGFGVNNDKARENGRVVRELSNDRALQAGLRALAQTIGTPLENRDPGGDPGRGRRPAPARGGRGGRGGPPDGGPGFGRGPGPREARSAMGKSFYFLWSLERVAAALNLETIGKKDWYAWGADVLLLSQQRDGTWAGDYSEGGVDTCFALLFLKRSNLVSDLSKLTGRVQDPGQRVLNAGGVGGDALGAGPKNGGEARTSTEPAEAPGPARVAAPPTPTATPTPSPTPTPKAPALGDSPGEKLAAVLVGMPANQQGAEIERLRDQKGAINTEALSAAIPFLGPDLRRKARTALAEREARMRLETIGRDLHDENAEIRLAAAAACALKETKGKETRQFIPQLIELLSDPEVIVSRGARTALRDLSGEDFGPATGANEAERKKAVELWQAWWKKQPH